MDSLYSKSPLKIVNGIPIFSKLDDSYITNYERIARDHLSAVRKGISNPFIDEEDWDKMEETTLQLILKYLNTYRHRLKIRILDVGVGLGRLLKKLDRTAVDLDLELYGIDISIQYLSIAKQAGINVALSKVEDMPYREQFFDIIICTDVLEHVIDLNTAVANILEVLHDGGYLIIRVPNKENLEIYTQSHYPYYYTHLRTFDKYSLMLLMERVFNLRTLEVTNGLLKPAPNHLRYILPPTSHWGRFISRLLRIIRLINGRFYETMLHRLYEPIEINAVFQKQWKDNKEVPTV
jgi:2-polyprenyl-3-methyl-5-hydroxy-6-metoxy-1,4-benzoquinol methylase